MIEFIYDAITATYKTVTIKIMEQKTHAYIQELATMNNKEFAQLPLRRKQEFPTISLARHKATLINRSSLRLHHLSEEDAHNAYDVIKSRCIVNKKHNLTKFSTLIDDIQALQDDNIDLIMTTLALECLANTNLYIFFTGNPNISSINFDKEYSNTSGVCEYSNNHLLVAHSDTQEETAQTLMHEIMHYLHYILPTSHNAHPYPSKDDSPKQTRKQHFEKSVQQVKKNKYSPFVRENITQRISGNLESYNAPSLIRDEYAADTATIIIKRAQDRGVDGKRKERKEIYRHARPLLRYFLQHTKPALREFIRDHDYKSHIHGGNALLKRTALQQIAI